MSVKRIPLALKPVIGKEGLFMAMRSDGKKLSVRKDRQRYFFPDEWINFLTTFKPKQKILFETLIQTGARISEALSIRAKDYDFDRGTVTLYVTKSKAKKGEKKEFGGRKRTFQVSQDYLRRVKNYLRFFKIKDEEKLFKINRYSVWNSMRAHLKKAKIKDYYNFSLHNIRKTHGMWLKSLMLYSREITEGEICMRLGHDMDTYLKHYGSPSIFNERDKTMIIKILGGIYGLR